MVDMVARVRKGLQVKMETNCFDGPEKGQAAILSLICCQEVATVRGVEWVNEG